MSPSSRATAPVRLPPSSLTPPSPTPIYTLSLHDALPIYARQAPAARRVVLPAAQVLRQCLFRSEEHTSELQSPMYLVCRLLLEKKKDRHSLRDPLSPAQTVRPPPRVRCHKLAFQPLRTQK